MKNLIRIVEYKGQNIKIFQDENSDSPNDWGNTDAFIVNEHRNFDVQRDGFKPRSIFNQINRTNKFNYNGYFVFTLFAYIHSGVALSIYNSNYPFNCKWDVSTTGFVLIKREKGTYSRKKAEIVAQGLLKTWNDYLSGNVYGYQTENDSCYGYYGDIDTSGILDDAKGMIDFDIEQKAKNNEMQYGKQLELSL